MRYEQRTAQPIHFVDRAEGRTIRQIAAALDQKAHIVKGWLAPKSKG
jgi:hypothetical protein